MAGSGGSHSSPVPPRGPQQATPCACMHSRTCPMCLKQGWQSRAGVLLICCTFELPACTEGAWPEHSQQVQGSKQERLI